MGKPDLLVVGAGPAGAISARVAASHGVNTLLIDKKLDIEKSTTCGGLISINTWNNLEASSSAVLNQIHGVIVHSPNGSSYELSCSEKKAVVIDRDKLNADLLSQAQNQGVKIKPGYNLVKFQNNTVTLNHVKDNSQLICKPTYLIGADGPRSDVRRLSGCEESFKLLYAIQVETAYHSASKDLVHVFFGEEIAPGFFGWVIPTSAHRARIGLATSEGHGLLSFLSNLLNKLNLPSQHDFQTGVIPIGTPGESRVKNMLSVGDAAGQVKPTTGGGLYPISRTAKIAGLTVAKSSFGDNNPSTYYRKRWMKEVGEELKKEMLLHKILGQLSDQQLANLLKILGNQSISTWLINHGDIDHLYKLAKELLKQPRILTNLLKALPAGLGLRIRKELTS